MNIPLVKNSEQKKISLKGNKNEKILMFQRVINQIILAVIRCPQSHDHFADFYATNIIFSRGADVLYSNQFEMNTVNTLYHTNSIQKILIHQFAAVWDILCRVSINN